MQMSFKKRKRKEESDVAINSTRKNAEGNAQKSYTGQILRNTS